VKESKRLKKVMKTILKVGNQMNNDGNEDQKGFSLATLSQLQSAKAFDKKTSILQYVVMLLHRNDEDLLQFPEELAHLGDAAKIGLDLLEGEKNTVQQGLATMRALVAREAAKDGQQLDSSINTFIEEATKRCALLDMQAARVRESFTGMLNYFGEDPAMGSQDFFATLHRFLCEFVVDREAYLAHKKREERLAAAKRSAEAGGRGGPMRRASTMSGAVSNPLMAAHPPETALLQMHGTHNEEGKDAVGASAAGRTAMSTHGETGSRRTEDSGGTKPMRRGTIM